MGKTLKENDCLEDLILDGRKILKYFLKENDCLEELILDGRKILKYFLEEKWESVDWFQTGSGQRETGMILWKRGKFLDKLRNFYFQ